MPTGLRPSSRPGVRLPALAAQAGAVRADGPAPVPDVPVTGVTLRAQDVLPGDLFAALTGSATHGARFAGDAIQRGAVAVLTDAAGVAEIAKAPRAGCRYWCIPHPAACSAAWPPRCMETRPRR